MSPRVLAAFILLPLAVAAERFAWYAGRSFMAVRMQELGGVSADIVAGFGMPLVGGVIGGALAVLLLPRIVLVAGALCTAARGRVYPRVHVGGIAHPKRNRCARRGAAVARRGWPRARQARRALRRVARRGTDRPAGP